MNNFGVIEVASTKTTNAPGWAYVPDTPASAIPSQSVSAVHLHVNRNKRAARNANGNAGGSVAAATFAVNERHDAKLQKDIEQLQRDSLGGRADAQIPIPSGGHKDKDGKIRGHTANVRKILASQKTFANHLDDFDALRRTQGEAAAAAPPAPVAGSIGQHSASGTPAPSTPASSGGAGKRGGNNHIGSSGAQKRGAASSSASSKYNKKATAAKAAKAAAATAADVDVAMTDAPPLAVEEEKESNQPTKPAESESQILTPFTSFAAPSHPGDADPLLASWLPPLPTDEELRELMRAPPLNYHQARGTWANEEDRRYPTRYFCEICGYWGRVRCMKCGTRVCALDCLDVHREDCISRYGL